MPTVSSPLSKLNKTPGKSANSYVWADYIEFLCLASPDKQISQADVIDRVRGPIEDLNSGKADQEHDLGDLLANSKMEDYQLEETSLDEEKIESPAEVDDEWEEWITDRFTQIEYRTGVFTAFYPFSLSEDKKVLRQVEPLTLKHKLYLFFLLASNLHFFNKTDTTTLTSIFEVTSFHALEQCLPANSKRYMFGKHPRNTGPYTGQLWTKLNKLAEDIGEEVRCKRENFNPRNSGDAGLDLVAWVPWDDKASGYVMVFGQCGCGVDWSPKQSETSMDVWTNYLSFSAYPFRMTFIPHCFRSANGDWYNPTDISKTVVVDRPRLTSLLNVSST